MPTAGQAIIAPYECSSLVEAAPSLWKPPTDTTQACAAGLTACLETLLLLVSMYFYDGGTAVVARSLATSFAQSRSTAAVYLSTFLRRLGLAVCFGA